MKKILIVIFVFSLSLIHAQEKQRFIDVNGTAEVILSADQINLSVRLKTVDDSIELSKKNNDGLLGELMLLLKETGISSDDIQSSPVALGKNYEFRNNQRIHEGYYAEVTVNFLLRDLSKYYELTNKLSRNDFFEITNSTYGISDYETQHKKTIEKALLAAENKAEYMAQALKVKLGEVLEIEENNSIQSYFMHSNTIAREESPYDSINGKVVIERSVRVKFSIN